MLGSYQCGKVPVWVESYVGIVQVEVIQMGIVLQPIYSVYDFQTEPNSDISCNAEMIFFNVNLKGISFTKYILVT